MAKPEAIDVEIGRIFLDLENPRHEPYETEEEAIEYLCREEAVLTLAKDIVDWGLNPLELFAVMEQTGTKGGRGRKPTYVVAEGNRRLCALKLLDDPDRAPAKHRKAFAALSERWGGVDAVPCMLFENRDAVKLWLSRIHEGEQGGIGRKKWSPDQIARHSGDYKNKVALALLDYAEGEGFISSEQRRGTLTTVQRYLANPVVREAFGIDSSNIHDINRNRPKDDFDKLVQKFLADLASGHVNSRSKKQDHLAYARELLNTNGITQNRLDDPESLQQPAKGKARPKRRTVKPHKLPRHLPYENEIMHGLKGLGGDKLPTLYSLICNLTLESYAPLIGIGAWAFFETLSARAGRQASTDFPSFFSNNRISRYGLSSGKGDKAIRQALDRISQMGDVTKHDGVAALFNGPQLANDMDTLKGLILKCIEEIAVAQAAP